MQNLLLYGERIYLRRLTEEDATQEYVDWMNDPEVNQYLESRFTTQTIESIRAFISSVTNDRNYQFGIFLKDTDKHIGNIKIGGINPHHNYADIGFLVGDKDYWGKGIATEAIGVATAFAFKKLKLHRLWGGVYAPNIGSLKAFLKNGYEQEGVKKSHVLLNGVYLDSIMIGKVNPNE